MKSTIKKRFCGLFIILAILLCNLSCVLAAEYSVILDTPETQRNWFAFANGNILPDMSSGPYVKREDNGSIKLNTCSGANSNPMISKIRFGRPTNGESVLPMRIKESYSLSYDVAISAFAGGTAADGNFTSKASVANGNYLLSLSIEKDGLYIQGENGLVLLKPFQAPKTVYNVKALVKGKSATITVRYNENGEDKSFSVNSYIPTFAKATDAGVEAKYIIKNNIVFEANQITAGVENAATIYLNNIKLNNVTTKDVVTDDCESINGCATYNNMIIKDIGYYHFDRTRYLALSDSSENGSVTYTMENNSYIKDFEVTRRMDKVNQGAIKFYIISEGGAREEIAIGNNGVMESPNFFEDSHMYFYYPSDTLKNRLDLGFYSALTIEIVTTANGTNSGILNADIEYNRVQYSDPSDDITVPDGYVILDDNCRTQDGFSKWYAFERDTFLGDAGGPYLKCETNKYYWFNGCNATTGVDSILTKINNKNYANGSKALASRISDSYTLETEYIIYDFVGAAENGYERGFTARTTVINENYLASYSIEQDGIYVFNDSCEWERRFSVPLSAATTFKPTLVVNGNNASLRIETRKNKATETNLIVLSWTLPDFSLAKDFFNYTAFKWNNNVVIDCYRPKLENNPDANNYRVAVYKITLKNTTPYEVLKDDASELKSFGTYTNMGIETLSEFSQPNYYGLTDKTQDGNIIYTMPDGSLLRDFVITRKVQNGDAGGILFYVIDKNDNETLLDASMIKSSAGRFFTAAHLYDFYPTQALKNMLGSGQYKAIKTVVSHTDTGTSTTGILRAELMYEVAGDAQDFTFGVSTFDVTDGKASFYITVNKALNTQETIQIILASYTSNGTLVDLSITPITFSEACVNRVCSSEKAIAAGDRQQAFIWKGSLADMKPFSMNAYTNNVQ